MQSVGPLVTQAHNVPPLSYYISKFGSGREPKLESGNKPLRHPAHDPRTGEWLPTPYADRPHQPHAQLAPTRPKGLMSTYLYLSMSSSTAVVFLSTAFPVRL